MTTPIETAEFNHLAKLPRELKGRLPCTDEFEAELGLGEDR